ncbi:hypothetical protein ABVK25_011697 [Lepraria finkii]|uniref:Uncharacterized protein n=1 Tax=Lepraria finkii TaxID=1340010 RepID=A0ABR4AM95_9LECA
MAAAAPPVSPIPTIATGPAGTPTATEFVTVKYSSAPAGGPYTPTTQTIPFSDAVAAYSSALSLYSKSTATATGSSPNPTTSTFATPTATAARSSTSSSVTPSPPTFSTGTPNSSTTTNPSSSATSTSSGTSAPPSTNPAAINSSGHGLSNGTVAGIVIGVAVGLALITFLATFLAMRRRRGSGAKNNSGVLDTGSQHYQDSEPKGPSVIETPSGSTAFENFLPQSADDKTVQNNVKTTLDHIELHVENFYQNASASGARSADAELATFNSPYLPSSLAALLPQTNNRVLLNKHALAHFITSCISATASPDWSLLPEDFVLLPSAIRAANSSRSTKPGFGQSMSRWRVLTAYLRPNPLDDTSYIAQRDHQINEMVQVFSGAFAPWQNPKYKDKERVESLSAILKEAAGLGIWMFSQPSELQFQWPKHSEVGSNKVAVTPALVKLTDERGQSLSQPQVMIKIAAQKV